MAKLDYFHTTIISNYIDNEFDFIKLMITTKKFERLNEWYDIINPPFESDRLFKTNYKPKESKFAYITIYNNDELLVDDIKYYNDKTPIGLYLNLKRILINNEIKIKYDKEIDKNYLKNIKFITLNSKLNRDNIDILFNPDIEDRLNNIIFPFTIRFNLTGDRFYVHDKYVDNEIVHNNEKTLFVDKIQPNSYNNLPNVKTIHISDKIKTIPFNCFNNLPKLKYIYLNQVEVLEGGCFNNCNINLIIHLNPKTIRDITCNDRLKYELDSCGFYKIRSKDNVHSYYKISDKILSMCEFKNKDILDLECAVTKNLKIPSTVSIIEELKLSYFEELYSVDIPSSVVLIEDSYMFSDCEYLETIDCKNKNLIKTSFNVINCPRLYNFPFYVHRVNNCPNIHFYTFYDPELNIKIEYNQIANDLDTVILSDVIDNSEFDAETNDNNELNLSNIIPRISTSQLNRKIIMGDLF